MYTLDTNVIIYFIKDEPATVSLFHQIFSKPNTVYISTITEIELFSYANLLPEEIQRIERMLTIIFNHSG